MLDQFLNDSSFGGFLKEGASVSYEQFQKNLIAAKTQVQLGQFQLQQQDRQYRADLEQQNLNQILYLKEKQRQRTLQAFDQQVYYENQLNAFSNRLTQINNNVYRANSINIQNAALQNLGAMAAQENAVIGDIYSNAAAGDVLAGTGSNRDVATQAAQVIRTQGMNQYGKTVEAATAELAKAAQNTFSQMYQNMTLQQKQRLEKDRLLTNLDGGLGNPNNYGG